MNSKEKLKKITSLFDDDTKEKIKSFIDLYIEIETDSLSRYKETRNFHVLEHEISIEMLKKLRKQLK